MSQTLLYRYVNGVIESRYWPDADLPSTGWYTTKQAAEFAYDEQGSNLLKPSAYGADLTMDGTAQSVALATNVRKIRVTNRGATTEAIRVAFGESAAEAESNLTIATGAATTGVYIPALADAGAGATLVLAAPSSATHYAVANAVASDTQVVSIEQGV